ncbi:MAG: alpha/beta hydrolase domain-containing protein [Thermoanaerobaculia bacterium]
MNRVLQGLVAVLLVTGLGGDAAARALETELMPVTEGSTPFFASAVDLAPYGFVEEEYRVRGEGDIYEYSPGGSLVLQQADVPYETRMLVRKPTPGRFNGVVVLEMLNPTAGFDIDFEWQFNRELLLSDGYAWVGLTIKPLAVDYLRGWRGGVRYATLDLPDTGLGYSVMGQVGSLLKDATAADNPLAGYAVETLIGTGYSQSSDWLTTFGNEFHDVTLAPDGSHAFDGYLAMGGNCAAHAINNDDEGLLYVDGRRLNSVNAPVVRVHSETEVEIFFFPAVGCRQPDSDVYRHYEVAGASHADREILERTGEVIARDVGGSILPPCQNPLSPMSISPMHRASLANLVSWIEDGVAPPPGVLIDVDGSGAVLRDAFGNALGGVRLPTLDVPLGQFQPRNFGPGPCVPGGSYFEFDEATLDGLYPHHGPYVSKVTKSANRNAKDRFLLHDDAVAYIVEAAHSEVGH